MSDPFRKFAKEVARLDTVEEREAMGGSLLKQESEFRLMRLIRAARQLLESNPPESKAVGASAARKAEKSARIEREYESALRDVVGDLREGLLSGAVAKSDRDLPNFENVGHLPEPLGRSAPAFVPLGRIRDAVQTAKEVVSEVVDAKAGALPLGVSPLLDRLVPTATHPTDRPNALPQTTTEPTPMTPDPVLEPVLKSPMQCPDCGDPTPKGKLCVKCRTGRATAARLAKRAERLLAASDSSEISPPESLACNPEPEPPVRAVLRPETVGTGVPGTGRTRPDVTAEATPEEARFLTDLHIAKGMPLSISATNRANLYDAIEAGKDHFHQMRFEIHKDAGSGNYFAVPRFHKVAPGDKRICHLAQESGRLVPQYFPGGLEATNV